MFTYDIYSMLFEYHRGTIRGGGRNHGVIVYGRVNNKLPLLPAVVEAKYGAEIARNHLAVYSFDLFAIQMGISQECVACAADGRIAVILPDTQPEHQSTALECKLLYLRRNALGQFLDANLVLGCLFRHIEGSVFELLPAAPVAMEDMNIDDNDISLFWNNLIRPDRMVSAQQPYERRLGIDCPILSGSSQPLPMFYDYTASGLTLKRSLRGFMQMILDRDLTETRSDWSANSVLLQRLGTNPATKSLRQVRKLNEFSNMLLQAVEPAEAEFKRNRDKYLTGTSDDWTAICQRISALLSGSWSRKAFGMTGKARVKALMRVLLTNADVNLRYVEDELAAVLSESSAEQTCGILFGDVVTREQFSESSLYKFILNVGVEQGIRARAVISFLWSTLGIRSHYGNLLAAIESEEQLGYLLFHHPYALTYVYPSISISDLDRLACFVGKANVYQEVMSLRAIAEMHWLLSNHDSKSTVFLLNSLQISNGYHLKPREYAVYQTTGSLLSEEQIELAREVMGNEALECGLLQPSEVKQGFDEWKLILNADRDWVLNSYIRSGMGILLSYDGKDYLTDFEHAYQTAHILRRMLDNYHDEEIDFSEFREGFEQSHGITLEIEQAGAAQLLEYEYSCLTGIAGSGKTTTLKYLIHCLTASGYCHEGQIVMVAPTGMAARRMTECTGIKASTLHSYFRIGSETFYYDQHIRQISSEACKVIIFDECSMISMPLLYQVIRRIPEGIKLIFTGDIEQLPPISLGKPFADLLTFLPSVRLLVSKRAQAGSAITSNCSSLLDANAAVLQTGKDVGILSVPDADAPAVISDICAYYLGIPQSRFVAGSLIEGTFAPSDIQVVTPVSKSSYPWGSTILNEHLRFVFNPKKKDQMGIRFDDGARGLLELREGDRVLNSFNDSEMPRYVQGPSENEYVMAGTGVLNGDIGVIKRICPSADLNLYVLGQNDELVLDGTLMKTASNSVFGTKLFVFVEYEDITGSRYLVAYSGIVEGVLQPGATVQPSSDLRGLSLAYAVTTHKMQGSQARLIIAPLYKCKARGFISRNMIYTAWSRAREGLLILGDVRKGYSATLEQARKIDSLAVRTSSCDII